MWKTCWDTNKTNWFTSTGKVDECQLQGSFMFTPDRFGMFVVGFLLFFMAGGLATNSHVRIAVGTILIAALGVTMMAVWIAGRYDHHVYAFVAVHLTVFHQSLRTSS